MFRMAINKVPECFGGILEKFHGNCLICKFWNECCSAVVGDNVDWRKSW